MTAAPLRTLFLLVAAASLCACAPAPVEPTPPSQRERQVATLRELGFNEADDGWLMSIAEPISFEFNQAELRATLKPQLEDVARNLLAVGLTSLRIEGHSDDIGTREYNERLSLQRSEAVTAAFVGQGFARKDIECRGLAWDYPVASNDTSEGRAQNRRVTVIVPAQSMASDL